MKKSAFTSTERHGFTMAEILLSLTIIGVVAAITLPSLTGNINERTWNTQRKALYARISQAISLMPALNGFGTVSGTAGTSSAVDTAAETFIASGLSKVLKINNVCDNAHLADCGLPNQFTPVSGTTTIDFPTKMSELNPKMVDNTDTGYAETYQALDTVAVGFETQNGESIALYYNPKCVSGMGEVSNYYVQGKICANLIFDLNGSKGPNAVGKDIGFMTILYPTDSEIVAPHVPTRNASSGSTFSEALSACRNQDAEYRIPTMDELASIFVNQLLIDGAFSNSTNIYWSATAVSADKAWGQGLYSGYRAIYDKTGSYSVRCVRR